MTIATASNATAAQLQAYQASSARGSCPTGPVPALPAAPGSRSTSTPAATANPRSDSATISAQGLALLQAADPTTATG
jgi:hypothetical protein